MKKHQWIPGLLVIILGIVSFFILPISSKNPVAVIDILIHAPTPIEGQLSVELYEKEAPITVKNFISYSNSGFYDNTIFHRLIPNFVIQGGGYDRNLKQKQTNPPIQNEATNKLKNTQGTLAMARTSAPHSASSQFFINLKDNPHLDHRNTTNNGYGYAVFGKLLPNQSFIKQLTTIPVTPTQNHQHVPQHTIEVIKIQIK